MGESRVKTIEDIGSGMRCGDIVLTWYDGSILADLIRLFTKDGPSHAAIYIGGYVFAEQTFPTARYGSIREIQLQNYDRIVIGYHKTLESLIETDRQALLNWLLDEIDIMISQELQYDVWELIENALAELGIDKNDDSAKDIGTCSWFVESAFRKIGRGFCDHDGPWAPYHILRSDDFVTRVDWKKSEPDSGWVIDGDEFEESGI